VRRIALLSSARSLAVASFVDPIHRPRFLAHARLTSREPTISPLVFTLLLFLGMLIMLETGRRLDIARRRRETDSDRSNLAS